MSEKIPFGSVGREINVFLFDRDPETHDLIITPNGNYRIFKASDVVVMIGDEVRIFKSIDDYARYEKWISGGDLDEIDLIISAQEMSPFRL